MAFICESYMRKVAHSFFSAAATSTLPTLSFNIDLFESFCAWVLKHACSLTETKSFSAL